MAGEKKGALNAEENHMLGDAERKIFSYHPPFPCFYHHPHLFNLYLRRQKKKKKRRGGQEHQQRSSRITEKAGRLEGCEETPMRRTQERLKRSHSSVPLVLLFRRRISQRGKRKGEDQSACGVCGRLPVHRSFSWSCREFHST